jgi:hypothetical protein
VPTGAAALQVAGIGEYSGDLVQLRAEKLDIF